MEVDTTINLVHSRMVWKVCQTGMARFKLYLHTAVAVYGNALVSQNFLNYYCYLEVKNER